MGWRYFSKLFSRETPAERIATFRFCFDTHFETNSIVSVLQTGTLNDFDLWVAWLLYYPKMLHTLGKCAASEELRGHLRQWAKPLLVRTVPLSSVGFWCQDSPLDSGIRLLEREPDTTEDAWVLDVVREAEEAPPYLQTVIPRSEHESRLAYTVIALGQYCMNKSHRFAAVLPLSIFTIEKYVRQWRPSSDVTTSVEGSRFMIALAEDFYLRMLHEREAIRK